MIISMLIHASLPSEVGGERINICQISNLSMEQSAIRIFPAHLPQNSMCKWLANNKKDTRSVKSSFNNGGLD
jgi:hypothetical protein